MALFNPPLCKPGNRKCPSCGNSVRRNSMGYLWSTRYCTQCGVALRHDIARFFAGLVVIAPIIAVWVWSIWDSAVLPRWAHFLPFVGYLLSLGLNWWWFPSIKLREKATLKNTDSP
jgi:uncharacterized protein (DUF983 family)